jgi:S1-C subfamily serine protease
MNARRVGGIGGAVALAAVIAIVVVALVGGFDSSDDGSSTSNTIHQIYEREGRSVYFVQSSGPDGVGTGTAWLFNEDGHLVTNEHVISGGTDIAVRVGENRLVPVEVVGEDQSTDLAVLKADPDALNGGDPFELADSSEVFVGQQVVAIGNPFGLPSSPRTWACPSTPEHWFSKWRLEGRPTSPASAAEPGPPERWSPAATSSPRSTASSSPDPTTSPR